MTNLETLLSHASLPLCTSEAKTSERLLSMAGHPANDLVKMLCQRKGFYEFENALHVFPANSHQTEIDMDSRIENNLWRDAYQELADNFLFFHKVLLACNFSSKIEKFIYLSQKRVS